MAATENLSQLFPSHNSVVPRNGVVTLIGYGIRVHVDRGHLLIKDGIGTERQNFRLPRVGHGLKRLVVISSDGIISLAALRWLSDQDVAFSMLERTGKVLAVTGPVRPSDAKLRRAQALALGSEVGLRIARELISRKLRGQEQVAREMLRDIRTADEIAMFRAALPGAERLDLIRTIEAQAAGAYWGAWRNLPITFPTKDLRRVPEHWRTFGTRKSLLTGSPRLAVNPPNAMLNYLYAILESESRLAASTLGLDPGLGVLHLDTTARDSLACDLMEAVRPQVDRYLIMWTQSQTLRREWFFEQRDGNCRLMASLTVRLSETASAWGRAVAPIAEWLAQELWASTRKKVQKFGLFPTRLTQQRKIEVKGREFIPNAPPIPPDQKVCPGCGAETRGRRHCANCGRELAREIMIESAKSGRLAAQLPEANKKRAQSQRVHQAGRKAWRLAHKPSWLTRGFYERKVQPKLSSITVRTIASALEVCDSYAADIRAGRRCPHPRHWQNLAQLTTLSNAERA